MRTGEGRGIYSVAMFQKRLAYASLFIFSYLLFHCPQFVGGEFYRVSLTLFAAAGAHAGELHRGVIFAPSVNLLAVDEIARAEYREDHDGGTENSRKFDKSFIVKGGGNFWGFACK